MGFFDKLFGGGDDEDRVVREPEFAGVQYPDDGDELSEMVDGFVDGAEPGEWSGEVRGIVAPYGDYRYAGPVMGAAYAALAGAEFERVLVLAPSEKVPFRGLAVAGYDAWSTPAGEVQVDLSRIQEAVERDDVRPIDVAFEPASALELQVPFLCRVAGEARMAPILVGDADGGMVASVLEAFWDDETLLVVGSNLSRGLAEEEARGQDAETMEALRDKNPEAIGRDETSGRMALRGMLQLAADRDWAVERLDYRTSADTAGDPDKVVGYGAFVVTSG
jgi:AmmeMemoRadiSam system protein B